MVKTTWQKQTLWEISREAIYLTKKLISITVSKSIEEILNDKNEIIINKFEIVNNFNHYFLNIAEKMATKISASACNNRIPYNTKTFFFEPITSQDIINAVDSLKSNSSAGADGVPSLVDKIIYELIIFHTNTCELLGKDSAYCCDNGIKIKNSVRYLGVVLGSHLNWNAHIQLLNNRLRKLIYES